MIEDMFTKNIIIESETKTSDGLGGHKSVWNTYLTVEGVLFDVSVSNLIKYDHDTFFSTKTLYIKPKNSNGTERIITNKHRVRIGSDIYKIRRVRVLADSVEQASLIKMDLYEVA